MPLAVVWGVFLFLGAKVMTGNQFLGRAAALLVDEQRLDPSKNVVERSMVELGRRKVAKFTAVQAFCLATLWLLKLNKATAMIFPSVRPSGHFVHSNGFCHALQEDDARSPTLQERAATVLARPRDGPAPAGPSSACSSCCARRCCRASSRRGSC